MNILCLDPGTRHTGIAISSDSLLAEPLQTIYEKNLDLLIHKISPLITKYKPQLVVIGQPDHGPLVGYAQDVKNKLSLIYSGEIVLFDENLSSKTARSKMREAGKKSHEIKQREHQTAAAIILQDYLDSL